MPIRNDRLENDYRALQKLCAFSKPETINLLETRGEPPEFYRIQISNCKGIEKVINDSPKYRMEHILVISDFPENYPNPGCSPSLKMETPLYHPDVYQNGIISLPGQRDIFPRLDDLVKKVISMIQYENLRFGHPANREAAQWANRNKHLFPLSAGTNSGSSKPKLQWR